MKVEYLESGADDCPLIRLCLFDANEGDLLWKVIDGIVAGSRQDVSLDELRFVMPVDGCRLTLKLDAVDRGACATRAPEFEWRMSRDGWLEVRDKIEPFRLGNLSGYQWLSDDGDISILLSPSGYW